MKYKLLIEGEEPCIVKCTPDPTQMKYFISSLDKILHCWYWTWDFTESSVLNYLSDKKDTSLIPNSSYYNLCKCTYWKFKSCSWLPSGIS